MRTYLIGFLFCVLPFVASAQTVGPRITFTAWYNLGDRGELLVAMQCATQRIRAATCLDVDISVAGDQHLVRWASPEDMPNRTGYISGADWNRQALRLLVGMGPTEACQVLVHEMVHALRRNYGHPGAQFSMSYPSTSISRSRLTPDDLARICSMQTCGCVNPEPAVPE